MPPFAIIALLLLLLLECGRLKMLSVYLIASHGISGVCVCGETIAVGLVNKGEGGAL